MKSRATFPFAVPDLNFILLVALFVSVWIAGGSSRADVPGQAIVRAAAWMTIVFALIFTPRLSVAGLRSVIVLLGGIIALPVMQLIPLPPDLWRSLPGRAAFADVVSLAAVPDAWRPLSLVPSATWNALASLAIPAAVILLFAGLKETDYPRLPGLMLGLIIASVAVALVQFTGIRFDQPLINYTGDVSGTFANRNHFAILAAIGCAVVPVWATTRHRGRAVRLAIAAALLILFVLAVLASGSRAGMAATCIALVLGPLVVRERLQAISTALPRRLPVLIGLALLLLIAALIGLSFALNRAVSINRLLELDVGRDMRSRGLPVVLAMTREYFPAGIGLGGFDPLFRLHEPFALLKPTYFNQAHNDMLGIVLDAGAAGLLVLVAALGWWSWASLRVWRSHDAAAIMGRLASAILLLVAGASIVDYPARTPMMMAVVALSAAWLGQAADAVDKSRLPRKPCRI